MEILVCLKQVPDDSVEIHLKPGTEEVNLDGVTPVVNAFDTYALEMATRLKEAVGGSITAITVTESSETEAIFASVERDLIPEIIRTQSLEVDTLAGATISCQAVLDAVAAAIG